MRDAWTFAAAATGLTLALAPVERAPAGAGPFDGLRTAGDVVGYDWRFPAEVSSGFMSGLYRSATNSAIGIQLDLSAPMAEGS